MAVDMDKLNVFIGQFIFALAVAVTPPAHAQTFAVLHSFNSSTDWGSPLSGVTIDAQGNLYGALTGAVYKLTRRGSGWTYATLYHGTDYNISRVVIGPDGTLYGAEAEGGPENAGSVFNLRPPATVCASIDCPWQLTALFTFQGGADGNFPTDITFDSAGNIYGTTLEGGAGSGTVYKLTPDHGSWTYTQITDFFGSDAGSPGNGVVRDRNGNLYGTSIAYPGQVFEVTNSGQVKLLYQFTCCANGIDTLAGVIVDSQGNLYGTTSARGPAGNGGTVFELSPSAAGWQLNTLQGFPGGNVQGGVVGTANLLMDARGNLYGVSTWGGTNSYGLVFKLAPSANGWIYTDLYEFTGGDDGCYPWDGVALDRAGNLYGTTSQCGQYGGYEQGGTLWEITP